VIVSVPLVPGVSDSEDTEDFSEKLPPAVTIMLIAVVAFSVPEVPVIVTVDAPIVAVALAVNVSTSVVAVGLVTLVRVTPLGMPEAARVTVPEKPFRSVTVTVTLQLLP
jgi:hypothetical protein